MKRAPAPPQSATPSHISLRALAVAIAVAATVLGAAACGPSSSHPKPHHSSHVAGY